MDRRTLLGIVTVAFLALSSLGFVVSLGSFQPSSFTYQGTCVATVEEIKDSSWIIYTLKDLNIPGTPTEVGIKTVPTEEVKRIVADNNLLYWTDAVVSFTLKGRKFRGVAYVLGNRKSGDEVLLNCYAQVYNGRLVNFNAIEIPPAS